MDSPAVAAATWIAIYLSLDTSRGMRLSEDFAYFESLHCSFLLTAEEKEPKKTATPQPLHRGFNLFRGKTLYIKDLVWLAKPVPYRASHILLNGALPHIYLIPCLNTEGTQEPLNNNPSAWSVRRDYKRARHEANALEILFFASVYPVLNS
jgi:hypothetical protein